MLGRVLNMLDISLSRLTKDFKYCIVSYSNTHWHSSFFQNSKFDKFWSYFNWNIFLIFWIEESDAFFFYWRNPLLQNLELKPRNFFYLAKNDMNSCRTQIRFKIFPVHLYYRFQQQRRCLPPSPESSISLYRIQRKLGHW